MTNVAQSFFVGFRYILWHRAFDLNVTNVAQSFFVGFRYNPGLDLSVVRIGLCAMNPQEFGFRFVGGENWALCHEPTGIWC